MITQRAMAVDICMQLGLYEVSDQLLVTGVHDERVLLSLHSPIAGRGIHCGIQGAPICNNTWRWPLHTGDETAGVIGCLHPFP